MNESAIEKAAEAIVEAANRYGTKHMSIDLADYLARAAYPHLSVWEEPTEEEEVLFGDAVRNDLGSHVGRSIGDARRRNRNAPPESDGPNVQQESRKLGLDAVIDARNDLVALEVEVPCEGVRDQTVMIFDLLIQVLTEHFPLICDSAPERNAPPVDPRRERLIEAFMKSTGLPYPSQRSDAECSADIALAAMSAMGRWELHT